ncbi:MAG TPA: M20/M25/M40 family metallo-hydrolase [Gaiellaceae bacterium]|nr:M20/M25/M40 family metallo-hydrolase [Gaiellaceae bacterium]
MIDVVELLQELIRFDTTNPPGSEEACVAFVERLLQDHGIETRRYERVPGRPSLVAEHAGSNGGPPLLLYGHVDVVTTSGQQWTRPPFAGDLADGYVWGRGALDMKSGVAMCVAAFVAAHEAGSPTPLRLLVLSDEEAGGDEGARFIAEEHPEALGGARHALGEFGGASQTIAGTRFYPIQVAEKQMCQLRATIRGPGGHGALGVKGGAMRRLGDVLRTLDRRQPPVQIVPVVRQWVEEMAARLPRLQRNVLLRVLDPRTADLAVRMLGPNGRLLGRVIRNTASATIVRGGEKINVVPSEVELQVDGRLLPGRTPDDLIRELHELVGDDVELEVIRHDAGPPEPDLSQYGLLADVIRELDPEGIPVPMLQAGVTDARFLSRAGVQTYGFLPLKLPADFEFLSLIHAADERVPADAVPFGVDAILRVIERYRP